MERHADHYEVLQLSPRADEETLQRVFRHLAKRFHPDNRETGNAERFKDVMEAFRVLSDPELRAAYDARYEEQQAQWRVFDQESALDAVAGDRRLRAAILALLYTARRNDAERPGIGIIDLERLLGCPEQHMKFHIWYLKENGWIQRLEDGTLALTAPGVDRVLENGGPNHAAPLLESGGGPVAARPRTA
jgi:hypothetical protein